MRRHTPALLSKLSMTLTRQLYSDQRLLRKPFNLHDSCGPSRHQPASVQTIALGAATNGKLNGIRHDSVSPTSVFDNYIEYAALCPRSLWGASGGIATNHQIVHVNRNTPTPLRAPHEALGHFAL